VLKKVNKSYYNPTIIRLYFKIQFIHFYKFWFIWPSGFRGDF